MRIKYVLCVKNAGYRVSLEVRKIYRCLSDKRGGEHGMLRVVDETGEDYLFPKNYFVPIDVPKNAQKLFKRAA